MAPNTYEYGVKYREDNKEKLKENDSLRYYYNQDKKLQAAKDKYAANPEAKNEYDKAYNQTPQGKKKNRKSAWKKRGVIFETKEEFEAIYKIYLETEFCNFCKKIHALSSRLYVLLLYLPVRYGRPTLSLREFIEFSNFGKNLFYNFYKYKP